MRVLRVVLLSLYGLFMLATPGTVSAQVVTPGANPNACGTESRQFFGLPTWYKYLNPQLTDKGCEILFDAQQDIPRVLLAVFEILMYLLGVVAVVMVVWGGITYILSQGEPEATKNARNTIVNAFIGLSIALSATAIVNLIGNNLLK